MQGDVGYSVCMGGGKGQAINSACGPWQFGTGYDRMHSAADRFGRRRGRRILLPFLARYSWKTSISLKELFRKEFLYKKRRLPQVLRQTWGKITSFTTSSKLVGCWAGPSKGTTKYNSALFIPLLPMPTRLLLFLRLHMPSPRFRMKSNDYMWQSQCLP